MNKVIPFLVILIIINISSLLPTATASDIKESLVIVDNGKIFNGRTLIPIKVVSKHFGYQVNWNQGAKTVTIVGKDTTIVMKVNSSKVIINDKEVALDVPAQIYNGVTYVPLKFLNDALGADISWNQSFRVARVKLGEVDVLIYTQFKPIPKMTDKQIEIFSNIANNAAVITDINYAKSYFKPYFTEKLLGNIIWYKGLPFKTQFDSTHQGNITYNNIYNSEATISQIAHFATLVWVKRTMVFLYVDNSWKISKIDFEYTYF